MSALDFSAAKELETRVLARTGSQLSDLGIELSPEGIRSSAKTTTFYVNSLPSTVSRDVPKVRLVKRLSVL